VRWAPCPLSKQPRRAHNRQLDRLDKLSLHDDKSGTCSKNRYGLSRRRSSSERLSSRIVNEAEWEKGSWRYRVQTGRFEVVVAFIDEERLVIATVMRYSK